MGSFDNAVSPLPVHRDYDGGKTKYTPWKYSKIVKRLQTRWVRYMLAMSVLILFLYYRYSFNSKTLDLPPPPMVELPPEHPPMVELPPEHPPIVEVPVKRPSAELPAAGSSDRAQSLLAKKTLLLKSIHQERPLPNLTLWKERQDLIVEAALDSWKAYKQYAWGHDLLHPISKTGDDWFDLGLTIIDSLDTLWIMSANNTQAKTAFQEAREWIATEFKPVSGRANINLFETTIRVVGGFMSTFELTKDTIFLEKAELMGKKLLPAFSSNTDIPYASVNLELEQGIPAEGQGSSSTAEVASIQLEFNHLSHLTKNPVFKEKSDKIMDHLAKIEPDTSLAPIFINPHTGQYDGYEIRLGSRGDSFYEYLLKQWLQSGQKQERYKLMWDRAWSSVKAWLLDITPNQHIFYIGEWINGVPWAVRQTIVDHKRNMQQEKKHLADIFSSPDHRQPDLHPKMDHLVCYLPGTVLLSVTKGKTLQNYIKMKGSLTAEEQEDYFIATQLMETCYKMYTMNPTHLAAEITYFNSQSDGPDMRVQPGDGHNLMRPETVESLFYFWRITQNETYREWGWNIWEKGFAKYSKVETGGYACLSDATVSDVKQADNMETFWMASMEEGRLMLERNT